VQTSPDLPPGRTVVIAGNGDLSIESAADAPAANLHRPWVIEVLASPIATIFNRTQGTTFGKNYNGTNWFQCIDAAADGDVIEISPGAINATEADCANYFNGLDNSGMVVVKGVTIRNIPGRGRWRLFPAGTTVGASRSGITIFAPSDLTGYPFPLRKTIILEGFDITDQFGANRDAYGLRIRQGSPDGSTWDYLHTSVTVRNFKIGKTSGTSGSGINNGAEALLIEDGHVFDCGWSGYEHNFYISARTVTMRGIRSSRTRGALDGHIFKTRAANTLIEGCVFDASGAADNTDVIQLANGGNHVLTGCLFIQGTNPSANNGVIVYENEQNGNQPWYYGIDGHSLSVRGCVFVSRAIQQYGWGCPMVRFRDPTSPAYVMPNPLLVADNIGANATLATNLWIARSVSDSTSGWVQAGDWSAANSVQTYDATDSAFTNVRMLEYRRAAGAIAASGPINSQRFQMPHGYISRSDSSEGLG
jgi:hypothetical protein